jgi:hypothetical protein
MEEFFMIRDLCHQGLNISQISKKNRRCGIEKRRLDEGPGKISRKRSAALKKNNKFQRKKTSVL